MAAARGGRRGAGASRLPRLWLALASSAGFARDAWAPLRRIYFIEHGGASRITPLDPTAALRRFIPVTTVPWQAPGLLDPALATIGALVAHIPCAVLAFRPEACAVAAIRADLAANREPG